MLRRTTGLFLLLVFFLVPYRTLARVGLNFVDCLAFVASGPRRAFGASVRFPAHTPPARRRVLQRRSYRAGARRKSARQQPAKRTKAEQAVRRQRRQSKPSIKQSKSTALRVGATFTVGCARPAAPITQRIHPRSSGGQEFGECSRSCVGRSCRVAPAIPRPPAPNSTSFKGSAVGRHPCWEITLGLTLLRTGMPR